MYEFHFTTVTSELHYLGPSLSNTITYHYSRDSVSWVSAQQRCEEYGMTLIAIEDANDNANVARLLREAFGDPDDGAWIGVYYRVLPSTVHYCCHLEGHDEYRCGMGM